MDYNIHLDNFDGPMDLLLHFVHSTKLDICEINMTEIIEQYLAYISTLQTLNIDIGSEFLLMAASLLHLKSKILIGKTTEEETNEDEYNITSEEDLKQRIIEYEKYKNVIKELQALEQKRSQIYTKIPENLKEFSTVAKLFNEEGLSAEDLKNALLEVQKRLHYKEPIETKITRRELSVKERVEHIRTVLTQNKHCYFEDLFEENTKEYIIVTFLAILEMCKAKEIKLSQEDNFNSLLVEVI